MYKGTRACMFISYLRKFVEIRNPDIPFCRPQGVVSHFRYKEKSSANEEKHQRTGRVEERVPSVKCLYHLGPFGCHFALSSCKLGEAGGAGRNVKGALEPICSFYPCRHWTRVVKSTFPSPGRVRWSLIFWLKFLCLFFPPEGPPWGLRCKAAGAKSEAVCSVLGSQRQLPELLGLLGSPVVGCPGCGLQDNMSSDRGSYPNACNRSTC